MYTTICYRILTTRSGPLQDLFIPIILAWQTSLLPMTSSMHREAVGLADTRGVLWRGSGCRTVSWTSCRRRTERVQSCIVTPRMTLSIRPWTRQRSGSHMFSSGKAMKRSPSRPQSERMTNVSGGCSQKLAAHLSGLGWIGKSCLLVTPDHGPRVRWVTVLTDAPLRPTGAPLEQRCGECTACVDICPVHALTGKPFSPDELREARFDATGV